MLYLAAVKVKMMLNYTYSKKDEDNEKRLLPFFLLGGISTYHNIVA
jgi:hypothetical protein